MEYSDIDAFLENNIKSDFSIITGIAYCVKNCIYNNLLISSKEIPFDNSYKPDISDVIHSDSLLTKNMQIKDAIEWSAQRDGRIKSIENITVTDKGDYETAVDLKVKLIDRPNVVISFNFTLDKR